MRDSIMGSISTAAGVSFGLAVSGLFFVQPAVASTSLPTLELYLWGQVSGTGVTPNDLAPVGRGPVTMQSYGPTATPGAPSNPAGPHSALLYDIYTTNYTATGIFANQINNLSAAWVFDNSRADAIGYGGGSPRFKLQFGTFDPITGLLTAMQRELVMYFGSGSPFGIIQNTGNAWDVNNTSITWQLTGSGTLPPGSGSTTDPGVKAAILADLGAREMITAVIHLDGATGSSTQTMTVHNWYLNTTGIIVPGPGAIALLGAAGIVGSRRRRN